MILVQVFCLDERIHSIYWVNFAIWFLLPIAPGYLGSENFPFWHDPRQLFSHIDLCVKCNFAICKGLVCFAHLDCSSKPEAVLNRHLFEILVKLLLSFWTEAFIFCWLWIILTLTIIFFIGGRCHYWQGWWKYQTSQIRRKLFRIDNFGVSLLCVGTLNLIDCVSTRLKSDMNIAISALKIQA